MNVRLADGRTGWVAARFVAAPGEKSTSTRKPQTARGGCPPDSDYAFVDTPTPSFSELGAHGLVVIEATVNIKGVVTSTKLVSNGTGDETLAFLAEREIKATRFSPPIRNCVPRAFIFTYRRTF
jgi:outer membrane biosynthesis protein TonB